MQDDGGSQTSGSLPGRGSTAYAAELGLLAASPSAAPEVGFFFAEGDNRQKMVYLHNYSM